MSLGTGLNIVQCRTRKTTKAGRGTPLPTENLEKTMLGDAFFLVGGGAKAWEAFGITHFYEVAKNNDQYSSDLVV